MIHFVKHCCLPTQTNPVYLAKLIFEMPQNQTNRFMESVILTLLNYASNQREEYLLLKLFKTALTEEIRWVDALGQCMVRIDFLKPWKTYWNRIQSKRMWTLLKKIVMKSIRTLCKIYTNLFSHEWWNANFQKPKQKAFLLDNRWYWSEVKDYTRKFESILKILNLYFSSIRCA